MPNDAPEIRCSQCMGPAKLDERGDVMCCDSECQLIVTVREHVRRMKKKRRG